MNRMRRIALLLFFWLSAVLMNGQNVTYQNVLWNLVQVKAELGKGLQIREDLQEILFIFPGRQHMFQTRTLLTKTGPYHLRYGIGFMYMRQSLPHDQFVPVITNVNELRPIIHLSQTLPLANRWKFKHRLWTEIRYFDGLDDQFHYSTTRVRYYTGFQYQFSSWGRLDLFNEIHINTFREAPNLTHRVDQNRAGFNVWYTGFEQHKFAIGYYNWWQERALADHFFSRQIFKLTYQVGF